MIDNGLYVDKETKRHTSVIIANVTNAAPTPLVGASAKRVRITFINQGADVAFVRPSPPNVNPATICLPTAGGIFTMDYETHGSLLQSAWSGQANTTNTNISVIDTVES